MQPGSADVRTTVRDHPMAGFALTLAAPHVHGQGRTDKGILDLPIGEFH